MKNALVMYMMLAAMALAVIGCSSFSTVNPRAMTLENIIAMSAAGAGNEVIKDQIIATGSRFRLTPDDIVRLKKEKVADDVIRAMIETGGRDMKTSEHYAYDPLFDYYGWPSYYGPVYGYGYPYEVWRRPGLIGRFYNYAYPPYTYDPYGPYSFRWQYESARPDSTRMDYYRSWRISP